MPRRPEARGERGPAAPLPDWAEAAKGTPAGPARPSPGPLPEHPTKSGDFPGTPPRALRRSAAATVGTPSWDPNGQERRRTEPAAASCGCRVSAGSVAELRSRRAGLPAPVAGAGSSCGTSPMRANLGAQREALMKAGGISLPPLTPRSRHPHPTKQGLVGNPGSRGPRGGEGQGGGLGGVPRRHFIEPSRTLPTFLAMGRRLTRLLAAAFRGLGWSRSEGGGRLGSPALLPVGVPAWRAHRGRRASPQGSRWGPREIARFRGVFRKGPG